jgi:hypothetical protein
MLANGEMLKIRFRPLRTVFDVTIVLRTLVSAEQRKTILFIALSTTNKRE